MVLESWIRAATSSHRLVVRAKIILASAKGRSVRDIASSLDTSQMCLCRWRERYGQHGLGGLQSLPRSGRPKQFTLEREAEIVSCYNESQIHQIWKKHGLQPHRVETFKFSREEINLKLPVQKNMLTLFQMQDTSRGKGGIARMVGGGLPSR